MVSIFEINSQKKKNDNQKNSYIQSGGNTYGINPYLNKNRGYTSQMEKLDKELADEGLKIERLSDKDKRSYVNSLTDTEYSRLLQYKNAGYSFGASKALLDMEKQQAVGKGGYRGAGFQIAEPLGGMDSTVNKSNIIGYVTEKIDDRVQNTLIPKITVTEREEREQELLKKYNNMSKEDWDKVYQDFLNDPNAKRYEDDSLDYTLKKYWEENNKSFLDKLRGAGLTFKEGEDGKVTDVQTQNFPSPAETIANVPSSALANATAVIRGRTNPVDNLAMLVKLIGTKEGRDLLAYRYLNEEGRNEAIEKDPVGWVLDLFDFGALGGNVSSKVLRTVGTAQRLAGATEGANRTTRLANNLGRASDSLENVADMGLTRGYDNILNKALGRLSEGGRGANLIGDYISLTQRPLATLRAGANPKDEKGNYIGKTNGAWTINGVQNGVTNVLKSMKDKIQTQATGLTPEVRERIRQNPFIKEYRDRIEAMILDEGLPMDNQKIMAEPIQEVGQELLRRLEEYESRLQEDGKEYQILDKTTKPYNISAFLYGVYDVFAKNGISLTPDGELDFRTTANPADMNPVKVAWNLIRAMEPNLQRMTIKEIREFRQQLRSLIKYQSDAPSTKYSKKVLREIVDGAFNKVVHKEIPGLAKVDELYTKRLNELREFKDGLVYQVGEKKGQIKDNFYSIISTLNTQNRQKMKARIEKLFPDLGARVEAIRMLPILAKTYQNSPQMMRALFQRAGFLGGIAQSGGVKRAVMGWLLGIVADELFAKPMGEKRRKKAIDDLLKEVSPEALQKLAEIKSKVDAGIELSEQEKQDLATAMQEVAMAEYEYLDEQHKKEFDKIMESANNQQPKLPQPGMDVINPDGTITLGMGNQLNSPETYKPKFLREMSDSTAKQRDQIVNNELQNGYERETTEVGDRFINKQTGDKGAIKYNKDGTIEAVFTEDSFRDSGVLDILPDDALVRFAGEPETIKVSEIRPESEYQTVGRANPNERDVTAEEGLAMKNFRDGRTAQELADDYGLEVAIVDKIFTEAGEEALGRAKGNLIELVRQIKEGTAPHEVFHPIFNMVDAKRRAEIIDLVRKNKGMTEKEAKEWLADNFSEYFRTGKFDTKPIPKGFVNKVKWFFNKVKEFLNGTRKNRKKIQKLFDDILEGKIETDIQTDMIGEYFYNKKGGSPLNLHNGRSTGKPPKSRLSITDGNSSVYKNKLDDLRSRTDSLDSQQFIDELRGIFVTPEESNYLFRDINGEPYTLRVADHGASTKNYKNYKQLKNNTSVVVEFTKKRWRSNDVVDLLELRYDKDTLTDSQKKGIIDGIKDWMDTGEYTDKQYNSKKVSPKTEEEYQYQIQQKSLFDGGEPSNEEIGNFIVDEYPKINSRIQPLAERNGYTMEAFARRLDSAYDPDIETWRKTLKDEEIDLTPEELVMITDTIKTMVNDPKTEKIISKIQQGPIKAFRRLLERMKENPLNVPENLGGLAKVKEQQTRSPLERYLEKHLDKIDIFYKTYDPDIVERRWNLQKKGRTDITMNELYKVKNLIDEHLKTNGIYINKSVPDQPTAQLLMESAQMGKSKKIGAYDKKQIEKVGSETNELLQNRIVDVGKWLKIPTDQYETDFAPQVVYELGKTYDPDIEKRQKNLKKSIKKINDQFEVRKTPKRGQQVINDHALNSLKAKVKELEKYSYDDIFNAFEGQEAEVFFRAVKPRIEELKAKGVEKAVTNLVALHNLEEDSLRKLIENFNGKDPMPSIAVMDVNVPHEVFGDISLVFGRDTVDPKVDERNKIYGSDAWTPTFPSVKEVGGVSYDEIKKFVGDKIDNMIDRGLDIDQSEAGYLWNDITRLISQYSERVNIRGDAGMYAEQIIDDLYGGGYEDFIKNNEEAVEELKEDIWTFLENIPNDRRQVIPASYFETNTANKEENIRRIAEDVAEYLKNDPEADHIGGFYDEGPEGERKLLEDITNFVEDRWDDGTETIIDKLAMEYGADEDVLRGIVEKYYLPEGDRPLTPENVLIAMKNQRTRRETYPGAYEDMIEIEGTNLNDIEDVRRQNFAKVFHGDRTGEFGDLKDRYNKLIDMIREYISDPDMIETVPDNVLKTAVKVNYDTDVNKFKENMEGEGQFSDVPTDILQRVIDVVEQGKRIPIRFSESKPERIVNLMEEVQYILVPEGADASQVKSIVRGTPLEGKVVEYKPDNNSAPRSRKLKELQKKYGNVFFSMGGVIMPIAMLLLMMQQGDEDQGEGQQA